jgi:hypothetical protein
MHHYVNAAGYVYVVADVMMDELKAWVANVMNDVLIISRQQVIYGNNTMTFCDEAVC